MKFRKFSYNVEKVFQFRMKTIQTDDGIEFTYKYISDDSICVFEKALQKLEINNKLILLRTPWHKGKCKTQSQKWQRIFLWLINIDDF